MRPVIQLFAKAPVAGCVKTRLGARFGPAATLELHHAFVQDTLEKLLTFSPAFDVELHLDIETDAWREAPVTRRLQCAGDLGSRMFHALDTGLGEGRPQVCIVGSDAPTLPAAHLRAVLDSETDVTLGPAEDGGYWAIACRRVAREMFRGVAWSTPAALAQTEQAVRQCGLSLARGRSWFDVDEPEQLARLVAGEELPRHTAAWVRRFWASS